MHRFNDVSDACDRVNNHPTCATQIGAVRCIRPALPRVDGRFCRLFFRVFYRRIHRGMTSIGGMGGLQSDTSALDSLFFMIQAQ